MNGGKKLRNVLETLAGPEQFLFCLNDFAPVFSELSPSALKMLISRAIQNGDLEPVCRGLYLYPRTSFPGGSVLYRAAAKLRAGYFNYISLESALSDAGVISQIPLQWITLMSGGRSTIVRCGKWGTIEFVHTAKKPEAVAERLLYDDRCGLWRAPVSLAIEDMKACRRSLDLVDWSVVNELV